MTASLPPSPLARRVRTPSWFDLRLVAGVLLVLGSVAAGIAVVSSAEHTERVWAVEHDLGPGVVLQQGDLRVVAARLPDASAYFDTRADPVGQMVTSQLLAGELLPRSALGPTSTSTTVTIPLSADDAPAIKAGQRITVWVSTKSCPSATVLADTTVQDVQAAQGAGFGSGGGEDVVVRLSPADARRVIEALALSDAVIRAGVLSGAPPDASEEPTLALCGASGS